MTMHSLIDKESMPTSIKTTNFKNYTNCNSLTNSTDLQDCWSKAPSTDLRLVGLVLAGQACSFLSNFSWIHFIRLVSYGFN